MDYYISVTENCNLTCSFCFINHQSNKKRTREVNASDITNFIKNQKIDNCKKNIIFYGGEPLLNQPLIEKIITLLPSKEFVFSIYTNGLLLSKINKSILEKLSYLIVSIDGDKEKSDVYRGKRTLEKVLINLVDIKKKIQGNTIARLTVTNYSSIYKSIMPIVDQFDNFFWQLESSPSIENIRNFHKIYSTDLDLLLKFWIENMEQGKIYNFIPFQSITTSIIFGKQVNSLRCGCGSSFMFINTDGNCYLCDELIDNKDFFCGSIYDSNVLFSNSYLFKNYIHHCNECNVKYICGGRCIATYIKYCEKKFKFYCTNTKMLINKIEKLKPKIENIILNQNYSKKYFDTYLTSNIFEEIP